MAGSELHETERLIRYAEDELSPEEHRQTDQHLQTCARCQEFLSFVKDFNATLRTAKPQKQDPGEPCPDSSLIVALEQEELDERTTQQVRAHLLFCDACMEEYLLLRRFSREEADMASPLRQHIEKLKESLLDLGQAYGIGTMLGPFRIVAETPAYAMRGGAISEKISKTVEVTVGENTYGVELTVSPEGDVLCHIAGFRTPAKAALSVAICSETGEELLSTRTDNFGNARFVVRHEQVPTEFCLFIFAFRGIEQQVLLRIGAGKAPV